MAHELDFAQFSFGTQVRKSPFSDAALRWGAKGFSVYNHMYIPRDFGDPHQNFWNLVNDAILCDVSVERQVQIKGPDAARFTQYLTCRDLSKCAVGQCKYVLITDQDGGIINDPILLKLAEDKFWLSTADSDVLLWARGVAVNSGMNVEITEPDVSPLQLQGPKSREILRAAFGDGPTALKYFWFTELDWDCVPLIISRTGWSSELGYEIYLRDGIHGDRLWEHIMAVGSPLGLKPGHTSSIRRIEAGMLSYHADMNLANNPFELNLGRLVDLDMEADFVSKSALKRIEEQGVSQQLVGLEIEGDPFTGSNDFFWPIMEGHRKVGTVTSAIYSPRLKKNIALAMVNSEFASVGKKLTVNKLTEMRECSVVPMPFYDPSKSIASAS
ncbi:aminomethyltransferase [Cribrihabitans marinus]|uniref:Aminomethyltransferase n=1 Tax=Cribrihabitans marinus TaxID=1227549 RepID=A0A1H6TX41_9RHOB|nr:glycine cleavage T C-terminal barrel domain-containing protein [Cribrihabitans marinus]GGH21206.1 glycine cleavage system protein T [Cribrihabitans marinus]SEI84613.1 aminomethyltransferase [Cribrihabitans marinus]